LRVEGGGVSVGGDLARSVKTELGEEVGRNQFPPEEDGESCHLGDEQSTGEAAFSLEG